MSITHFILLLQPLYYGNLSKCSDYGDSTKITIVGIAMVIKNQASVQTDDSVFYYLDGIDDWDVKYLGKRIKVTGRLLKKFMPSIKGSYPENTVARQPRLGASTGRIITKAKWKLVK